MNNLTDPRFSNNFIEKRGLFYRKVPVPQSLSWTLQAAWEVKVVSGSVKGFRKMVCRPWHE